MHLGRDSSFLVVGANLVLLCTTLEIVSCPLGFWSGKNLTCSRAKTPTRAATARYTRSGA